MPITIYRAQLAILMDTGFNEDAVTNTTYFRDESGGSVANACDKITEQLSRFYTAFDGLVYSKKISGATVLKIYDMQDATPRVPKRTDDASITLAPLAGNALPPEVCICTSFKADAISGINPGSLRGRLFLGPLDEAALDTNGLVAAAVITAVVDATQELRDEAAADNIPLQVYSPTLDQGGESLLASAHNVTSGWVDNAPDTQRRRGVAATARTSWT